jgi:hypothetical protein
VRAKRSGMTSLQASRTLVKSPPELWAELSDLGTLARHLGEFGEIRITQADPESRVEWEADRASGTVRLEPTGWGTRVVLTVQTPEADPEPSAAKPDVGAAEPDVAAAKPDVAAAKPDVGAAEPEAVAVEPEPAAVLPEPESEVEPLAEVSPEPAAEPARRGFWTRMFRRTPTPASVEPEAVVTEPEPVESEPEPEPEAVDRSFAMIEWVAPLPAVEEPPEYSAPAPLDRDEAHAVLTNVLDTLGAAHHRPFSRS